MLTLIGLGLWDENDITLRGLNAVRNADVVYAEFYTSKLMGTTLDKLERLYGRKVQVLERKDLEEESYRIIEEAKGKNVVVLVAGDPGVATTHSSLLLEARKRGVETRVVHNASIISAVCSLTGLHSYKFGKSATVSYPYRGIVSRTPLEVVKQNMSINAHTLLLLDLNPKPMTIAEAVEILSKVDDGTLNHFAVGIARAGGDNVVKCDRFYSLRDYDFGEPLHCIVVLSRGIHITEYEFLREFAEAPKELEKIVE